MTTTVTIKHDGPDHHDINVEIYQGRADGTKTGVRSSRLKMGEALTEYVYDTQALYITEIEKELNEDNQTTSN